MGVFDGQAVSAAITNPAFLDANADDFTIGVLGLQNTLPASGTFVYNLQQAVNTLWTTTGATETVAGTVYSAPASTISDGQSHQSALTSLANKFHPTTGHKHTGAAGDAPAISASAIVNVPLIGKFKEGTDILAVTGSSVDVTSLMGAETPSYSLTTEGVVVNNPENKIIITQASGTSANDDYVDADGNVIYGRLTNITSVWTLSFYVLVSDVETAYSFATASDVRWYYQKLYNPLINSPVYSEIASIHSDNVTSDVAPATTAMQGKVLLSSVGPSAISSVGSAGTANATVANSDHTHEGVHSVGIFGQISVLTGDVQIEAGTNITAVYNSGRLKISSAGAVAKQEVLGGTVDGSNDTFGPLSEIPSTDESILVLIDDFVVPKTGWSRVGSMIIFTASWIPQLGQSVYCYYVTTGISSSPPAPTGILHCEYHTVTILEETAKTFTMEATPAEPTKVLCDLIGGSGQIWSVDFTITANNFMWAGLGLDGVILSGDVVRLYYYS